MGKHKFVISEVPGHVASIIEIKRFVVTVFVACFTVCLRQRQYPVTRANTLTIFSRPSELRSAFPRPVRWGGTHHFRSYCMHTMSLRHNPMYFDDDEA